MRGVLYSIFIIEGWICVFISGPVGRCHPNEAKCHWKAWFGQKSIATHFIGRRDQHYISIGIKIHSFCLILSPLTSLLSFLSSFLTESCPPPHSPPSSIWWFLFTTSTMTVCSCCLYKPTLQSQIQNAIEDPPHWLPQMSSAFEGRGVIANFHGFSCHLS